MLNVLTAVLQNYIKKIIIVNKNPRIYKIFDSNIQLAKVSDQPVQWWPENYGIGRCLLAIFKCILCCYKDY